MRRILIALAALTGIVVAAVALFRRNPRMGTRVVNERVNPFLVEHGLAGFGRSEIGTLEHVGRHSGARHLTPIHPEPVEDGFRIIVPLGPHSQWVQNVLAAGHCRLQLHGIVYELDEPTVLLPRAMSDLPAIARLVFGFLGFTYLHLHTFAERPGALEEPVAAADAPTEVIGVSEIGIEVTAPAG